MRLVNTPCDAFFRQIGDLINSSQMIPFCIYILLVVAGVFYLFLQFFYASRKRNRRRTFFL